MPYSLHAKIRDELRSRESAVSDVPPAEACLYYRNHHDHGTENKKEKREKADELVHGHGRKHENT